MNLINFLAKLENPLGVGTITELIEKLSGFLINNFF